MAPDQAIDVRWMQRRSRGDKMGGACGDSAKSALAIAFHDRGDVIVATASIAGDWSSAQEDAVLDFLNSDRILRWLEVTLMQTRSRGSFSPCNRDPGSERGSSSIPTVDGKASASLNQSPAYGTVLASVTAQPRASRNGAELASPAGSGMRRLTRTLAHRDAEPHFTRSWSSMARLLEA